MLRKVINSFALALANIRSNFLHTFLSVLGIVIGVAALVSILSLIDGMEDLAREQISSTTSLNAITIHSNQHKVVNEVRIRRDTFPVLHYSHYRRLADTLSQPADGYYRTSLSGEAWLEDKRIGVYAWPGATPIRTSDTAKFTGALYQVEDVEQKRNGVVVNQSFVKLVNDSLGLIGKKIRFENHALTIIGIVPEPLVKSAQIYFPITLLSDVELREHPPMIYFDVKKTEDIPQLKSEIQNWLHHEFGTDDNFTIQTNDFRIEQATKAFLVFRVVMGLIVGISVLVGGIGVMNVLLISVTERTAEIGIRKATGANKRDIILLFLSESITVSAFGSLLGLVLGVVGTMIIIPIVKAITEVPFQAAFTWNTLVVISIISLLVGIVFGTYPAIRAARLNPVDAIRHE
ncbi:MAG: ABC transporter permease [Cyclobacteriaceae bacterium]|nr:ABC transporter permease [Cyclobacteriaceae bacterium]